MRATSLVCKTLMWIVLVLSTGFAVLAMIGIWQHNDNVVAAGRPEEVFNLWPLTITLVLLWVGVLLFFLLKKLPVLGLLMTVAAGVAAVIIAFDLARAFPVQVSATGDVGLSTFKMIYRHVSPVLVPVLLIPAFFCDRATRKQELRRLEESAESHFDLSGAPVFIDVEVDETSDALAGTARREKRSVRVARRKRENA